MKQKCTWGFTAFLMSFIIALPIRVFASEIEFDDAEGFYFPPIAAGWRDFRMTNEMSPDGKTVKRYSHVKQFYRTTNDGFQYAPVSNQDFEKYPNPYDKKEIQVKRHGKVITANIGVWRENVKFWKDDVFRNARSYKNDKVIKACNAYKFNRDLQFDIAIIQPDETNEKNYFVFDNGIIRAYKKVLIDQFGFDINETPDVVVEAVNAALNTPLETKFQIWNLKVCFSPKSTASRKFIAFWTSRLNPQQPYPYPRFDEFRPETTEDSKMKDLKADFKYHSSGAPVNVKDSLTQKFTADTLALRPKVEAEKAQNILNRQAFDRSKTLQKNTDSLITNPALRASLIWNQSSSEVNPPTDREWLQASYDNNAYVQPIIPKGFNPNRTSGVPSTLAESESCGKTGQSCLERFQFTFRRDLDTDTMMSYLNKNELRYHPDIYEEKLSTSFDTALVLRNEIVIYGAFTFDKKEGNQPAVYLSPMNNEVFNSLTEKDFKPKISAHILFPGDISEFYLQAIPLEMYMAFRAQQDKLLP